MEKYDLLEPDRYYHIYNQGNDGINLFQNEDNYLFFLQKFEKYISPVAKIYSYALMPNHFHFLVLIKSDSNEKLASQAFANLFNSYAKAYNKQQKRSGSLFRRKFRRKRINNQNQLINTVLYIHNNPVKHGYCEHTVQYPWTSYHDVISKDDTFIQRSRVLELFEDRNNFIYCHKTD